MTPDAFRLAYLPAIRLATGRVISGYPGETHAVIYARWLHHAGQDVGYSHMDAGWVHSATGTWLDRYQAEALIGRMDALPPMELAR